MESGGPRTDRRRVPIDPNVAELLPVRYRETLDAIDRLMDAGARLAALRLRARAIEIYSGAWDASCLRRMDEILARASAAPAVHEDQDLSRVA